MSGWSVVVTIVYFTIYTIIMMSLALYVWRQEHHEFDRTFFKSVWSQRKLYSSILVYFYDTATDYGVIVTWYFLYEDEVQGHDYVSVDMSVYFWSAIAALLAYRILSSYIFCYGAAVEDNELNINWEWYTVFIIFSLAILDLLIFWAMLDSFESAREIIESNAEKLEQRKQRIEQHKEAKLRRKIMEKERTRLREFKWFHDKVYKASYFSGIYGSYKYHLDEKDLKIDEQKVNVDVITDIGLSEKEIKKIELEEIDPGEIQKLFMLMEAVFESMPQVVLQAVFLMKSYNDADLRNHSNQLLIFASFMASIVSIANRFLLVDRSTVVKKAQSLGLKKKWGQCCQKWYVVRVIWRFTHILTRFIIFALCWIIMGGLVFVLYVVASMCCNGYWTIKSENYYDANVIFFIIGTVGLPLTQHTGYFMFRWIENFLAMMIITISIAVDWDCDSCSSKLNTGVLIFGGIGWFAFCVDFILLEILGYCKISTDD